MALRLLLENCGGNKICRSYIRQLHQYIHTNDFLSLFTLFLNCEIAGRDIALVKVFQSTGNHSQ